MRFQTYFSYNLLLYKRKTQSTVFHSNFATEDFFLFLLFSFYFVFCHYGHILCIFVWCTKILCNKINQIKRTNKTR